MINFPAPLLPSPSRSRDRSDRLIPMINVVFLLLSFFIIAGTIRVADGLAVDPPQAETHGTLQEPDAALLVKADGALVLNGVALPRKDLLMRLADLNTGQPSLIVQVKADRQTTAGIILPLLDELAQQGIERVELVAIRKRTRP